MLTSSKALPQAMGGLVALVADFYWEQDATGRFTRVEAITAELDAGESWLGQTVDELGLADPADDDGALQVRAATPPSAFRDRIVSHSCGDGAVRYFSLSGESILGPDRCVTGYRGIGKDVTGERLQQRELTQLRAAMDVSNDMVFIADRATMMLIYVNDAACRVVGCDRPTLLEIPPYELVSLERAELEREYDETIRAGGMMRKVRSPARLEAFGLAEDHQRAIDIDGRWAIVSIVRDIRARKRAEKSRDRLARMYAVLSASNDSILRAATPAELYQQICAAVLQAGRIDMAAVLLAETPECEPTIMACVGIEETEIRCLGISFDDRMSHGNGIAGRCFRSGNPCISHDYGADSRTRVRHDELIRIGIQSTAAVPLLKGGSVFGVFLLAAKRKRVFDAEFVTLLQRQAENLVFGLDNFTHQAARKRSEEHVQYLATHDSLTGLPNRNLFNQSLVMAMDSACRRQSGFALVFLDLDRFKLINDSLGHAAGDTLLRIISMRLSDFLCTSDMVARIGGDEFLVLIDAVDQRSDASRVARKLLTAVLEPFELQGQEHRVTASMGIALYPEDAGDAFSLIKHADMAMCQAKQTGKNTFCFYSRDMRVRSLERMQIETYLRQALRRDEFRLVYQAKISLASGAIVGVEALLRWHSAELGEVTPNQFLSLAEEIGLIIPIGRWVLETACAQNMDWQRMGLSPLRVAVNLSAVQFTDENLVGHIKSVLRETGMPAHLLELEVTETTVMQDIERALQLLGEIKRLGVHIAIDDFGTDYSSLNQLRQLPVDSLKIDRSFIHGLSGSAADQSITQAIIMMGKNLSLNIVAEGVETVEQRDLLRSHACDGMQGFYFGRPHDNVAFAELLQRRSYGALCV